MGEMMLGWGQEVNMTVLSAQFVVNLKVLQKFKSVNEIIYIFLKCK